MIGKQTSIMPRWIHRHQPINQEHQNDQSTKLVNANGTGYCTAAHIILYGVRKLKIRY